MCVPSREAVRLLVNKFRETGSILDKKRNAKRRVLTEQKLEEIGERLENSPQKSLMCLAQETDISKAELMRVNANFLRRCRRCIDAEGQHFQHLL